ncbi:molybdopterin adenylyltransferase [Candidatus Aerophobetes bacterium]|nr:molybdopterin adenylyltransferase [Candidatus Aerophobetes bacterium]
MIKIAVITVSDRCSQGEEEDKSGPAIKEIVKSLGKVVKYRIIPDEKKLISNVLKEMIDCHKVDIVLTTGGTGLSSRDVTPEATKEVLEKEMPGFGELMRQESFKLTPLAILSRATAGTRKKSLIINLPGSPKGAKECLEILLPALPHALDVVKQESFA